MKWLYTIFLLILINNVQAQIHSFQPEHSTIINADKGMQLLDQASRDVPQFVSSYFDLNDSDITNLENNFKKLLPIQSTNCCLGGKQVGDLNRYVYQYVGIVIDGNRYIYINAFDIKLFDIFPAWTDTWKKYPIAMYDGGELYWGALFDLDKMTFSQLAFNRKIESF